MKDKIFLPKEGREQRAVHDKSLLYDIRLKTPPVRFSAPSTTFLFLGLRENVFGGVRIENLRTAPYDTSSLLRELGGEASFWGFLLNLEQVTGQTALYMLPPHK